MKFTNAGNFVCKTNDEAPRMRVKNNKYQAKNNARDFNRRGGPRGRLDVTLRAGAHHQGVYARLRRAMGRPYDRAGPNKQKTPARFSTGVKLAQFGSFNFPNRLICASGSSAGTVASPPTNGLQKRMPPDRCAIENTIGEQWIAVLAASEPCSLSIANAPVGRNRFIAPIGLTAPRTLRFRARAFAERRNKAIAPYDLVAARSFRANKQKPAAVSHPGEIGAIPEFQFPE
jgi:hypothetical protein